METPFPASVDNQLASNMTKKIWNEALKHFSFTNNELLLPVNVTAIIGSVNVERLKSQLGSFLGRPCVAFVDNSMGCVRILARPDFNGLGSAADHVLLSQTSVEGAVVLKDGGSKSVEKMEKNVEKKIKAPRPPNAFILYRKHYHAILKEQNPDMHNNEISVKVGGQWNNETPEVKAHYKGLAEEAKRQHAQKYPNYQYAPRKPYEKKRRNSRRTNANVESDTNSDYDEEASVQTTCESPAHSNSPSLSSTQDNDDVVEQTMDDMMAFVSYPSPPRNNYAFSDFDLTEYADWVDNANNAQRLASATQTTQSIQTQNGTLFLIH